MLKEFASFHNHSHFSVFDGLSLPIELLQTAKDCGIKSIALTDHGVTHGHADWYLLGKKVGIKTVYGVEAYLIHDLAEWRDLKAKKDLEKKKKNDEQYASDGDVVDPKELRRKGHLVLLACNRTGLSNLYQLVFKSHRDGFYGKPRMDKRMLREHSEGLVATSACMGGVIAKRLWDMKAGEATWSEVVKEARDYDEIFGRGRFFLELQFNEMDEEQNFINESLVRIHHETGIPLTVTTDSHYSKAEEWEARELLHLMGWSKKTVQDFPNGKIESKIKQLYVKSPEEMWLTYEKYAKHRIDPKTAQAAFEGTLLIDSLIDDFEPDTRQRLPTLPFEDPYKELKKRAIAGFKALGLDYKDKYVDRLKLEMGVIQAKGISNYFMVCQQIVQAAKKEMLLGAGRGSAAGSLVCWCLGITDLDPIKHDLLFERFLDLDRVELPDIDTDFEYPKRAKKILQGMFGRENVASLSSYGTFQIAGLLKDLGRVYGIDHNEINKLNRVIKRDLKVLYKGEDKNTLVIKLDEIERVSPAFNEFVAQYPELGGQIKKLYGRIRHVTRHAAGVIIGDNLPAETSCFVARKKDSDGTDEDDETDDEETVVQTSFTEGIVNRNLSAMGFVKMDLLGLANLRVIHYAIELITKEKKGEPKFDEFYDSMRSHRMDLDDIKVMKHVFWKGNFGAIFQFTNPGIRALALRVRPDSFIDISAIVSLYRPGPLAGGYHKVYINAKHGKEITFPHPLLEDVLGKTKGCLVFQEQIMKTCAVLGKMTGKEVNRVRKVLLKKDKTRTEEFIKQENDTLYASWEKGCRENGLDEAVIPKLWEDIKAFGGYAFNKSHSDAYSLVTMQTAWLATYYPLQFYAAALTKAQANAIQTLVADIQKAGVKILPIDINRSYEENVIEGESIRLSMNKGKGIGGSAIGKILAVRAEKPFESFLDFLERSNAGKTAIEPLIKLGAFKDLPDCGNTKALLSFYDAYCADPKLKQKKNADKLSGLFWEKTSGTTLMDPIPDDFTKLEKIIIDNELMEFSLAGSPFEVLDRDKKIERASDILTSYKDFTESEDPYAMIPVLVKDFKEKPQKNGKLFAFVKFAAQTGEEWDSPCFANIWAHVKQKVQKGNILFVIFNHTEEDPENLVVGFPGWGQSKKSSEEAVTNVDDLLLDNVTDVPAAKHML